jgi:hypothetical protein
LILEQGVVWTVVLVEVASRDFGEVDEEWMDECAGEVPDDYGLEFCEGDVAAVHCPEGHEDHSAKVCGSSEYDLSSPEERGTTYKSIFLSWVETPDNANACGSASIVYTGADISKIPNDCSNAHLSGRIHHPRSKFRLHL